MFNLIRVGNRVINVDTVMQVDLDYKTPEGDREVVFEFIMRGSDELDEGANIAHPYMDFFHGEEAAALRQFFKAKCPDLLRPTT